MYKFCLLYMMTKEQLYLKPVTMYAANTRATTVGDDHT